MEFDAAIDTTRHVSVAVSFLWRHAQIDKTLEFVQTFCNGLLEVVLFFFCQEMQIKHAISVPVRHCQAR